MKKLNYSQSGSVWEYGVAIECARLSGNQHVISETESSQKARECFESVNKELRRRRQISRSAKIAMNFLASRDNRFRKAQSIEMHSSAFGTVGDARDIVVYVNKEEIGISAKRNNKAVKHSRISPTIDFGANWYGVKCSDRYWKRANPIFNTLKSKTGRLWREMPNKRADIYLPLLQCFVEEVNAYSKPVKMVEYLIGANDFYKIILWDDIVELQSFNLRGTLLWGEVMRLPEVIFSSGIKKSSGTTAIVNMDNGWSISFRIHNASSRIESSLKFDVQLIGLPENFTTHKILINFH